MLTPACLSLEGYEYTRIFNARKSAALDRQIGDRRGRNAVEARICGPSASLPTGESLTSISIDPRTTSLAMGVTDRRDFYHQLAVGSARAAKNRLYPPLSAESLAGTRAMRLYQELHPGRKTPLTFQACFSSVLQGDHLGVEFATSAHLSLLQGAGLLTPATRIQGGKPLRDSPVHDGLIIDDFFCIAKVPRSSAGSLSPTASSPCRDTLDRALAAYSAHSILGSPEKDTANETVAKIGGAELNSAPATLDRGLCTAAAPAGKRFALTCVTLDVTALPGTSDSLHLCLLGAWSSVLSFRRPGFCVLDKAFSFVTAAATDPARPKVLALPRAVAQEFVLLSALAPVLCADLAAPSLPFLFATDASEEKGAACVARIPQTTSQHLWQASDRKGAFARMARRTQGLLQRVDPMHEEVPSPGTLAPSSKKPLAFTFDFLELFSSRAEVTHEMAERGWAVGPPFIPGGRRHMILETCA